MTRADIFTAITAERERQDEKHPVAFRWILCPFTDPNKSQLRLARDEMQKSNNEMEEIGEHSAYGLVREEYLEFFAETDKARQVEEAIQNAALWVRIIEEITK